MRDCLSEPRSAASHDLALADKFCIELATVKSKVYVKVHAVKSALRGIHALEIFLKILSREIGRESDDFFDACCWEG